MPGQTLTIAEGESPTKTPVESDNKNLGEQTTTEGIVMLHASSIFSPKIFG